MRWLRRLWLFDTPARERARHVGKEARIFDLLVGTSGLFSGLYRLVVPVIGPLIGGVLGVYTLGRVHRWEPARSVVSSGPGSSIRDEIVARPLG